MTEEQIRMAANEYMETPPIKAAIKCGDVVEGLTPRRISTQIYELTHIGYKAQRDLAIDVFSNIDHAIACFTNVYGL